MAAGPLRLTGGLSRSRTFAGILAGVLGAPIEVSAEPGATALGAALCAATGAGVFPDVGTAAAALVRAPTQVEPEQAEDSAALYERSLSTGLGYYARNNDLAGIGLNWADAKGFSDTQFTTEAFYRFNISPDFQITPSIQYTRDPLLDPGSDDLTILGLRARIVF